MNIRKMVSSVLSKMKHAEDVYAKHNIAENMNIVMKNIYAKRCVDDIVTTAFGKKCENLNTDILANDVILRAGKDFIKSGNCFFEVVVFNKKISKIYHISANTLIIERRKGRIVFKQVGFEEVYDSFGKDSLDSVVKKSFILHIMNYEDDSVYGTPVWVAAKLKLEQSHEADMYVDSFYSNNGVPAGALLTKGAELDNTGENDLAEAMQGNKGAMKRRGLLHIHMDEESDIKYIAFNSNIVDSSFVALQRDNKVDVCAAFGVPPKRVGLETPGRLGGGNDYEVQLQGYYEDIIIPLQVLFEKKLPFEGLVFTRPTVKRKFDVEKKNNNFWEEIREVLLA